MNQHTTRTWRRSAAAASAAALLVLTAACGGNGTGSDATQASTVTIKDPWVKAADTGMTAAFGTLRNASDKDATVVAASATSVTKTSELHEMATDDDGQMVMRPKKGGFSLPAGTTHQLSPGGDHIMLMDLTKPVRAGDEVRVTLTFADKSSMSFTAPARSYSGAEENYEPGEGDMSDMDMSHHGG